VLVLVTDVVSTARASRRAEVAKSELEQEMAALIAAKNFFTGTNPYRIVALLEEDAQLRTQIGEVELLDPWLWAVTPDRLHLTSAIVARPRLAVSKG
jgi:hypothetical protein